MKREKVEDEREGTEAWDTPLLPGQVCGPISRSTVEKNSFCPDVSWMMNSRHFVMVRCSSHLSWRHDL